MYGRGRLGGSRHVNKSRWTAAPHLFSLRIASEYLATCIWIKRGRKGDADLYLDVHVWEFRDGKISRLAGFKRDHQSMNAAGAAPAGEIALY